MAVKPIPSEDDIRLLYVFACAEQAYPDTRAEVAKMERQAEEAWSAFLAQVKRDAAREALDGLAEHATGIAENASSDDYSAPWWMTAGLAEGYRDTHYPEEGPR